MPGFATAFAPNGSAEIIDLDAVADSSASTGARWFSLGDTIYTDTLISWAMPTPPCILFRWILLDCRGRWFVAGAFEPKALIKLMDPARDFCEISPKEAAWILVRARVPLPPELEAVALEVRAVLDPKPGPAASGTEALPSDRDPLTLDDRAVAVLTRWIKEDRSKMSKRALARVLGCHHSSLEDCPTFQRLWEANQSAPRQGYRDAGTGNLEAPDDED